MQFTDTSGAPPKAPTPAVPTAVYICFRRSEDKRVAQQRLDGGGGGDDYENDKAATIRSGCTLEAALYRAEERMGCHYCHVEIVFHWSAAVLTQTKGKPCAPLWNAWCAYRSDGVGFYPRDEYSYRPGGWSSYMIALSHEQRAELFLFANTKNNKPFNYAVIFNFFPLTRRLYATLNSVCCNFCCMGPHCGLYPPGEAYFCTELVVSGLQHILKNEKTSIVHTLAPEATLPDTLHDTLRRDDRFIHCPMMFVECVTTNETTSSSNSNNNNRSGGGGDSQISFGGSGGDYDFQQFYEFGK
jgi:hypothetical protein